MHKKTIVLLCLFLTLLVAFAACKRHSRYGVLVVDEQGMEHVIMTDANGVTVINSDGNLVEIMTDSRNKKPIAVPTQNGTTAANVGAYQTHAVTFPGIVENGETVEDAVCQLTLPEGWEQVGTSTLLLHHTATDAQIQISSNIDGTLSDLVEKLNGQIEAIAPQGGYTQTDMTLDGLPATRTQYALNGKTVVSYLLLTGNGKVCRINCMVDTDKYAAADTDKVVESIRFK